MPTTGDGRLQKGGRHTIGTHIRSGRDFHQIPVNTTTRVPYSQNPLESKPTYQSSGQAARRDRPENRLAELRKPLGRIPSRGEILNQEQKTQKQGTTQTKQKQATLEL